MGVCPPKSKPKIGYTIAVKLDNAQPRLYLSTKLSKTEKPLSVNIMSNQTKNAMIENNIEKAMLMDLPDGGILQVEILEGNPFLRWRAISEWCLRNNHLPNWKEDMNELLELLLRLKDRMDVLDAMVNAMLDKMKKM